jgi:hypothetical protein
MTPYFVIILCDILCELPEPHGARGDVWAGNLSTASKDRLFEKPQHVVISGPYTQGSVIMAKRRFL